MFALSTVEGFGQAFSKTSKKHITPLKKFHLKKEKQNEHHAYDSAKAIG